MPRPFSIIFFGATALAVEPPATPSNGIATSRILKGFVPAAAGFDPGTPLPPGRASVATKTGGTRACPAPGVIVNAPGRRIAASRAPGKTARRPAFADVDLTAEAMKRSTGTVPAGDPASAARIEALTGLVRREGAKAGDRVDAGNAGATANAAGFGDAALTLAAP